MDELLWIWQKQSNHIQNLNSHIWDAWADDTGSIGKAYGYQMSVKHKYKGITIQKLQKAFPSGTAKELVNGNTYVYVKLDANHNIQHIYAQQIANNLWEMNQIDKVIYDLCNTPYSRRILTNIYTFEDLHEMNLHPCAYSVTFNVTKPKDSDKLVLNTILNQRSQDILVTNAWNVAQYSLLNMMVDQVCGMVPGEFLHVIADSHIYDRHVDIIKELITRDPLPAPNVRLNPDIHDFYDFTTDDISIQHFGKHEQIRNIPVAA